MDEPNPPPLAESSPPPPGPSPDPSPDSEVAFAAGSGRSDATPVAIERREDSVMMGLPEAKAERIASMRRELAELQRQLIEAQQRIATELQGRADDADRFEALEGRLQSLEVKAQRDAARAVELETEIGGLWAQLATAGAAADPLRKELAARDAQLEETRQQHRDLTEQVELQSSSLREAKALQATLLAEVATKTTELETAHATKAQLESDLEDERKKHRVVTDQLEVQSSSLRDANALVATRDTELDAARRALEASHAKARDIASQLARLVQSLVAGGAETAAGSEPRAVAASPSAERAQPRPAPPPPPARAAARPQDFEPIVVMAEGSPATSHSRSALLLLGGVILGTGVTMAILMLSGSSSTATGQHLGGPPSAALSAAMVTEPTPTAPEVPTAPKIAETAPPSASAETAPASDTTANAFSMDSGPTAPPEAIGPAPIATPEVGTDGVILLPPEAAGRRLFVDGRVVQVKGSRAVVPCGDREVRVGSRGVPRTIAVPCGGETELPAAAGDR